MTKISTDTPSAVVESKPSRFWYGTIKKNLSTDFLTGVKDSSPICIAFIFMCISFGGLSRASGLSLLQTMSMALLVYSIPLQVILIQLFKIGLTVGTIVILTLIINSRFFLMSITLVPYFKSQRLKKIILSLFILSASSFTVAHVKFTSEKVNDHFQYYLGVALAAYVTTFFSTLAGFYMVMVGTNFILKQIFGMALAIHFTALTAMRWPNLNLVIATALGFVMIPILLTVISTNASIVLAPLLTGLIIYLINSRRVPS